MDSLARPRIFASKFGSNRPPPNIAGRRRAPEELNKRGGRGGGTPVLDRGGRAAASWGLGGESTLDRLEDCRC